MAGLLKRAPRNISLLSPTRRANWSVYGNVFDTDIRIPNQPEVWLAMQYGKDWRIPNVKGARLVNCTNLIEQWMKPYKIDAKVFKFNSNYTVPVFRQNEAASTSSLHYQWILMGIFCWIFIFAFARKLLKNLRYV